MNLELLVADDLGSVPASGYPQPLLSGSTINRKARGPSTASLLVWAESQFTPFILDSDDLGVLDESPLGGDKQFRIAQFIQVQGDNKPLFEGFITRITQELSVELPDGRKRYRLDCTDRWWAWLRNRISVLTAAEVTSAYGSSSDKNTVRYAVSNEANSTSLRGLGIDVAGMDEIRPAGLDASLFTPWANVLTSRVLADIQKDTGAVVAVNGEGTVEYNTEATAPLLDWEIGEPGALDPDEVLQVAWQDWTLDGSQLASRVTAVGPTSSATRAADTGIYGELDYILRDQDIANGTVAANFAQIEVDLRGVREGFRCRMVHPSKADINFVLRDVPEPHRRVTVNDSRVGIHARTFYIGSTTIKQLSDSETEILMTLGDPLPSLPEAQRNLQARLDRVQD